MHQQLWVALWHLKGYQDRWFSKWQVLGIFKFELAILVHQQFWYTFGFFVPINPTPATSHERKQKLHCNFRKVALQHLLFGNPDFIFTNSCAATNKKLHCNIEKAASGMWRFPAAFLSLEGPTRKPRHASVFSTHSDTQAVPAFHCTRMFNSIFSTRVFFKTNRHAVSHCLREVQKPFPKEL